MKRVPAWVLLFALICGIRPTVARGEGAASSCVLPRGRLQANGLAGAAVIDGEPHPAWEGILRVGVGAGVEIALPAAVAVRLAGDEERGAIYLGLGVVDLYIAGNGALLFQPVLLLSGVGRLGSRASLWGTVDISGAEQGIHSGTHPLWLRGTAGLLLDMGSAVTLGFGFGYQRVIKEGDHPDALDRTGWVGDARISFGSTRARPFSDLPLVSVHLRDGLDFILAARFDINTNDASTDIRCLTGFSVQLF